MKNIIGLLFSVLLLLVLNGCLGGEPLPPAEEMKFTKLEKSIEKQYDKSFSIEYDYGDFIPNDTYGVMLEDTLKKAFKKTSKVLNTKAYIGEKQFYKGFYIEVHFPQSSFSTSKYKKLYGLTKKVYFKLDTKKKSLKIYKISSKMNFNEFSDGNEEKLRLMEISDKFDSTLFTQIKMDDLNYGLNKEISFKVDNYDKDLFSDTYSRIFKPKMFIPSNMNNSMGFFRVRLSNAWNNYHQKTSAVIYDDKLIIITGIKSMFKTRAGLEVTLNTVIVGKMKKDDLISNKIFAENFYEVFKKENLEDSKFSLVDLADIFYDSAIERKKYTNLPSIEFKY